LAANEEPVGNEREELLKLLERMLREGETITARAVAKKMPFGFRHASAFTRNASRKTDLEEYQKRQAEQREKKAPRTSRPELLRTVARLEEVVVRLSGERELLIASHRAMINVISAQKMEEILKFFSKRQDTLSKLRAIGAMTHEAK